MKKDMMVVGIKVIEDNLMELELAELVGKVNKKVSVMDLAGMSAYEAAKHVKGTTFHRDRIYVTREYCSKNNIVPFCSIELEVNPADKKRIAERYVG